MQGLTEMSHKLYKLTSMRYWFNNAWHVKRTIKPAYLIHNALLNTVEITTRNNRRGSHITYLEI
jgi:hypothetical protein